MRWQNGTVTDLGTLGTPGSANTLIPAGSPYQIQNATGINDNSRIVAGATSNHALLLTPG